MKPLLSIPEATRYSGFSRGMITNWLDAGVIPYVDLPPGRGKGVYRNRRIRRVDMDAFLEKYYHTGRPNRKVTTADPIILLPRTP